MQISTPANPLKMMIYDCFSDTRFGSNVGGIVLDAGNLDADIMQKIAREINAPITGFVIAQKGREITVRFFMPTSEIAMCGHVSVGLFSHLAAQAGVKDAVYTMKAPAGSVEVQVVGNDDGPPIVFMEAGLPSLKTLDTDIAGLTEALGLKPGQLGNVDPAPRALAGLNHLFIQLNSLEAVQGLTPDFANLAKISSATGVHTVACFSMQTADPGNTLHIRDFFPAVGLAEVPASGTTNAALAGYLVRHGLVPAGDHSIRAEQGAELGRPSLIRCAIATTDGALRRARIGGQAVASLRGTIEGA